MEKIIIILVIIASSCGAPYHIRKAIKKDPNIITERIDTVRFTFNQIDTVERISNDTVYTELILRQIDTMFLTKYKYIDGDKIKTRQEEKTERTRIRQEEKTERNEVKQTEKTERTESRKNWLVWLIIGITLIFAIILIRTK